MDHNTLRLRLSSQEVEEFTRSGAIGNITQMGPLPENILSYHLKATSFLKEITVRFINNEIMILMPEKLVNEWKDPSKIGFKENVFISEGTILEIIIEKDLLCK